MLAALADVASAQPSVALGPDAASDPLVSADLAPLFDAHADRVVASTVVPSPERRVGEVRLLRRGDADVVQTLLSTKVLSRVVGEIRKKEIANWPADRPGYADAVRYLAALEEVRDRLWREIPADDRHADRRQRMLIEFALDARRSAVLLGGFEADAAGGETRVTQRRPMVLLEPERAYVERNMRLIAADSFRVEGAALTELLRGFEHVRESTGEAVAPSAPAH
jgi:hypothetical protein